MSHEENDVHERAMTLKDPKEGDEAVLRRAKKAQIVMSIFIVSILFFTFMALGLTLHEGQARQEAIDAARKERLQQINAINQRQCDSLGKLYREIRITVLNSDATIDTIGYYKTHPEEAKRAHLLNRRTLARFLVPACPKDVTIPVE